MYRSHFPFCECADACYHAAQPVLGKECAEMKMDRKGVPADELRETMREMASGDRQWKERLASGVSYPAGDDVLEVAQQAYIDFFSVNALYPSIFPSTARFETITNVDRLLSVAPLVQPSQLLAGARGFLLRALVMIECQAQ